jgi:ABC-type molybdate transport system permease subunit
MLSFRTIVSPLGADDMMAEFAISFCGALWDNGAALGFAGSIETCRNWSARDGLTATLSCTFRAGGGVAEGWASAL